MRFSDDKRTLAYHLQARPLVSAMNFSELPARQLGEAARAFLGNHGCARVEEEALWFYLGEHAVAEIRKRRKLHEKLPEEERAAVEHAFFHNNKIFLRMMFYVAMICVRETRHIKNKATLHVKVPAKMHAAMDMFGNIPDEATSAMHHFLNKVPHGLTTGELLDAMSFVFHKGTWGHQFGGKKWGAVCDALRGAVHGKYSPATFCDLAFALQHNGGSIFNKHKHPNASYERSTLSRQEQACTAETTVTWGR